MNEQQISEILSNILKEIPTRNQLDELKKYAENGSELAQILLGNIYFYGITADNDYRNSLKTTVALAKYSPKNVANFAFRCSCNLIPNFDEVLKWYKAAANGNAEAKEKIRIILDNFSKSTAPHMFQRIPKFKKFQY